MTFRDGMDMLEAIELVEKAKAIETKALSDRARLLAERDGWREIALELLKASMGEEAELFRTTDGEYSFPPLELVQVIGHEPRAMLQQFWANVTRQHQERRAKHHDEDEPRDVVTVTATHTGVFSNAIILSQQLVGRASNTAPFRIGEPTSRAKRRRKKRGRW